jgi:hypothetical protein
MQVLDTGKPITIELLRKGTAKPETVIVAADDRIVLDMAGVEFEHRASGRRRFIPWPSIAEMYQSLLPAVPDISGVS